MALAGEDGLPPMFASLTGGHGLRPDKNWSLWSNSLRLNLKAESGVLHVWNKDLDQPHFKYLKLFGSLRSSQYEGNAR